jgi:pyruvate/2-oxoglutarate dehydrogenase complex dihydrolipoamide dehydrogenase (E3) component
VQTGQYPVPESTRGWIHKAGNDGFIKLVADAGRGTLVGATSVGPAGGEVLSMLTLAVHARVPVRRLREMIYAYPTFHRAVEPALARLG